MTRLRELPRNEDDPRPVGPEVPPEKRLRLVVVESRAGLEGCFVPVMYSSFTVGLNCATYRVIEDTVSRAHVRVELRGDRFWMADNGSTNGTWVDGEMVKELPLRVGTLVGLGRREEGMGVVFRVEPWAAPEPD